MLSKKYAEHNPSHQPYNYPLEHNKQIGTKKNRIAHNCFSFFSSCFSLVIIQNSTLVHFFSAVIACVNRWTWCLYANHYATKVDGKTMKKKESFVRATETNASKFVRNMVFIRTFKLNMLSQLCGAPNALQFKSKRKIWATNQILHVPAQKCQTVNNNKE